VLRWRTLRRVRFWLLALFAFVLLALGPFPRINGTAHPNIPLPYRLVGWSLPIRSLRNPERFNIVVSLCLALVVGISMEDLSRRFRMTSVAPLFLIASAMILLEYWSWPFPTRPVDVPSFYHQLAQESGEFAIVDLPITNDLSKQYMYYQTVHGKPTVTGHISRPPEGVYDFIGANDLLRASWQGEVVDIPGDAAEQIEALADAGVRYIVIHKNQISERALAALGSYLPRSSVYEDREVLVYSTGP
jgi:hypothetical protein